MADFLNQTDIDRLIAEVDGGAELAVFRYDGSRYPRPKDVAVEIFDFRTPIFLAETELRRLRMIHQHYIGTLAARFSSFLRADVNLKMSKLTTLPYGKFADTIQNPSHLTLFKVEPLPGVAVLEITPRLALSMTNRMLGGRGISGEGSRYLTEIEVALLEEIIQIIVGEWCQQWPDETDLNGRQISHETNARFLQVCSNDTIMLVLGMEALAGDTVEQIQIGVPYYMLEPVIKNMQAVRNRDMLPEVEPKPPEWRSSYSQISVPVIADWQVPGVAVSDLLQLRVGDVVEMPRTAIDNTRLRLSNTSRFLARAGCEDGRVAVQIHASIPTESLS
jgi:flagellar motor switch protein FliM